MYNKVKKIERRHWKLKYPSGSGKRFEPPHSDVLYAYPNHRSSDSNYAIGWI
jgi:hypothetical protein